MDTNLRDPWYRQFPEKLLGDARLRRLLPETGRDIFYEGRHVMHTFGQPYGHLALQPGVPMTAEKLADLLVATVERVRTALEDVFQSGLWARTAEGVLYDPDLIRVWNERQLGKFTGSQGGNPNVKKRRRTTPVNPPVNPPVKAPLNPPVNGPLARARDLPLSSSSPSSEGPGEEETIDNASLDFVAGQQLLAHLNAAAGVSWPESPASLRAAAIALRAVQGDLEGAKQAVSAQAALLRDDVKKRAWLRPGTLFERERFRMLYAERTLPVHQAKTPARPVVNRADIEAQLKAEKNPERRRQLLAQLNAA